MLIFIVWPILAMMCCGILFSIVLLHFQKEPENEPTLLATPLNFLSIVRTSFFIGLLLLIIAMARQIISIKWVLLISFLGGLLEIHGVSLATGLLYLGNLIHANDARLMLYIAILASFISKIALLWCLTPIRFASHATLLLFGMLASGVIIYSIGI